MDKDRIKEKIKFFKEKNIKVHLTLLPKKDIRNGYFSSELIDDFFYHFIDDKIGKTKLILVDIYDVIEYAEKSGDSE